MRKRRICARAGSRRISRSVTSVSPTPRVAAVASRIGWRASAGKMTKAGIEKTAKRAAAATKQPPYAWAAANGYAAANATSEPA